MALLERTGDERWLRRARTFAMHAVGQVEHGRSDYGRGRYTLWTGDIGTALYLGPRAGTSRPVTLVGLHLQDLEPAAHALPGCHAPILAWRIDPEGFETLGLARLAPVDGLRVLELGCGDGRLTFRYADAAGSVLAVDPDEDRINSALAGLPPELAGTITFAVAGAAEVAAPQASFDLALFSSSL